MAEIVRMPKLSDTMTEGVVAEWHKKVGDHVEAGELLAEIETDKATMEFESFQEGTLLHIGVEKGKTAPVDSILAILGEKGEDVEAIIKEDEAQQSGGAEKEAPKKEEEPTEKAEDAAEDTSKEAPKKEKEEAKPAAKSTPQKVVKTSAPSPSSSNDQAGDRVLASPLARRLAHEKGINLARVRGTGESGRIVKRDVEAYNPKGPYAAPMGIEQYTEEPISQMRKTIARRLSESKFTAPHFYLTMDIDMDNAMAARKAINALGTKISFNDMVVKACAMALRQHPKVNSSWLGDTIRRNEHVHIGVAVAVEEGLLVPVVRFADGKTLSEIGAEVKDYAQKAKDKKLQPEDWEGNTFTISNLGMYGIEEFTAIINPPDACILAIGGIKQTPVVKNGAVVPGNVMRVTLSCDHRVVDGVTGSEFLLTFKNMMENPVLMSMDLI